VRSITTGEGRTEYVPVGHSTGIAARMQMLAPVGSIAATETVRKLCEGYFLFRSLGPTKVKGVSERVNVYEVTGLGPLRTRFQRSASRGYTKFVGRQREMETIKHVAGLAKSGRGQIVAVVAEPGVGKSRLFHEFKAGIQSGWMMLEAFTVSHGKATAYLPVIELLRGYFRIGAEDDQRTRREKVNARVLTLDPALEDSRPYLFGLLGLVEGSDPLAQMDPQIRRRRVQDAIKRTLLHESLNQPVMLVFEDLHQIDDETQALLNLLADSIGTSRVLLLVNYRPEYSHSWGSKTYYTQVRLDPLGKETADEMLSTLLGNDDSVAPLKRLIAEKTEGNPLFMEEIHQALIEEGVLVRNGALKITRPLNALKIPATVQAILAARIDRLPAEQKELLETVAVIGKDFRLGLIGKVVTKPEEELERTLAQLQLSEFIYELPATGDIEYTFKHLITQEAAYSSILLERRKVLHERTAQALETLYSDRLNGQELEDHAGEIAHHLLHAGGFADSQRTIRFLRMAAERDFRRSALEESQRSYREAISLLQTQPQSAERDTQEIALHTALATLLLGRSWGGKEREHLLKRAYDLCERVNRPQQALPMLLQLAQVYIQQLRLPEARAACARAVAIAQTLENPVLEFVAWHNLGETYYWSGDLEAARNHLERALAKSDGVSPEEIIREVGVGYDWWTNTASLLNETTLVLGLPDLRAISIDRIAERARSSTHPLTRAIGLMMAVFTDHLRGGLGHFGLECLRECRTLSDDHGFSEVLALLDQMEGFDRFGRGERAEGIAQMESAIEKLDGLDSRMMSSWRLALLAAAQVEVGDYDTAQATCRKGLELMEQTAERWCASELYRIAAEIALRKSAPDLEVAEHHMGRAIEIARHQGAKLWELRSTVSLGRLLRDTNRRTEARAMLAEIYNWFTEGFDTTDLKDAKALLDELSGSP